jgi:3-deoxy-7-phosphoheptulonate synthase
MNKNLCNRKISTSFVLPTPKDVCDQLPPGVRVQSVVINARKTVGDIIRGNDGRLLCIVGPCSIHDESVALEYATRLRALSDEVGDVFFIVMRTYFEKPRTVGGWKGFLNDPYLDGSFRIDEGLRNARKILLECSELGLPVATEMLDLISPQYLADLVSWSAIGARTTESQSHRELASGLSMPVGFKNATNGDVIVAINAVKSAAEPHHFLSVDEVGRAAIFGTTGNPDCHVVLRGGENGSNYDKESIDACVKVLKQRNIDTGIVVDCSHGNSGKDYRKQGIVFNEVINLVGQEIECGVRGLMLESNLCEGSQPFQLKGAGLKRGVSITDSCIGWNETEDLIRTAADKLRKVNFAERCVA